MDEKLNVDTPEEAIIEAEPTIPSDVKSELNKAAKIIADLPETSTLSSGESTLPIPGTPAREDVKRLGLSVEVNPEPEKIERPVVKKRE